MPVAPSDAIMRTTRFVATIALVLSSVLPASAADDVLPPPEKTGGVDLADPAVVARGLDKLNTACGGYCHGSAGGGFKAPALRNRPDLTPASMHATISYGRKRAGKVMPPWKGVLPEEDIWSVIAAIVSLRHADGDNPPAPGAAGAH
jgi:mono/diheme cytochrome c family protein